MCNDLFVMCKELPSVVDGACGVSIAVLLAWKRSVCVPCSSAVDEPSSSAFFQSQWCPPERALQQRPRWSGRCSALQQLSGKQASEVRAHWQPCSAAGSVFALRSAIHGRVPEQTAALPLLERLRVGGLCVGPRGGGDRTKLGECLARQENLLFGERLHGFDV